MRNEILSLLFTPPRKEEQEIIDNPNESRKMRLEAFQQIGEQTSRRLSMGPILKIIDRVVRQKEDKNALSIVVMGSGHGIMEETIITYLHEKNPNIKLDFFSFDPSNDFPEMVKRNEIKNALVSKGENAPIKDMAADLCLVVNVLHHVKDDSKKAEIIQEANRIAKNFIIADPRRDRRPQIVVGLVTSLALAFLAAKDAWVSYSAGFTKSEMEELVKKAEVSACVKEDFFYILTTNVANQNQ